LTSRSTSPPEDDEDTIELELSADEMRRLSRAAKEAQASSPIPAGKRRFHLWPVTFAAALVGIAAIIAWRPDPPPRFVPRIAPTPVVASALPAASEPAVLAQSQEPQGPPVRVKNPFDATEVFEFPAGTTRAEARRKIAEQLLQRAVDRGSAGASVEAADPHPAKDK
jgi:hypothetical protein